MNSTVLHLPEHHGHLVAEMPSTISRPRMLVLYRRSGKLGKLPQCGRQDSGHVTVAVVSVNPGLDCMPTESTTDDETRRWVRVTVWDAVFVAVCLIIGRVWAVSSQCLCVIPKLVESLYCEIYLYIHSEAQKPGYWPLLCSKPRLLCGSHTGCLEAESMLVVIFLQ